MPNNGYNLPSALLYSAPEKTISGTTNWVSFKPLNRSSFEPTQTMNIRVSSLTDFLVPERSYLKYTLKVQAAATSASSYITSLGGASVISSVKSTVGGREIENIEEYNTYISNIYKRAPETQKNLLKTLELYGDASVLSSANGQANGYTICHALRNVVFEGNPQYWGLPYIRGGLEIEIKLEDLTKVCASAAPTGYTVENVELVCCMLKPSSDYLKQFQSKLASGSKATMPLQVIRQTSVSTAGVADAENILQIGFYKSLRNVSIIGRTDATLSTKTTDAFANDSLLGLQEFSFRSGSERFPKNFQVKCGNDNSVGAISPENIMMSLCSLDNTFAGFNSTGVANTDAFVHFDFSSDSSFSSGIPVEDGTIVYQQKYSSAPSTTNKLSMFFGVEGKLEMSYDGIDISFKDL